MTDDNIFKEVTIMRIELIDTTILPAIKASKDTTILPAVLLRLAEDRIIKPRLALPFHGGPRLAVKAKKSEENADA